MGIQKSFIKLKATMDDVTFYVRNGKYLVRKKGGVDRERILKDPKFVRTRENMQEFGGAAKVSKLFRHTLNSLISEQGGSLAASRLTGIFKRLASRGPGKRGQRSLLMAPHKKFFEGFEFNEEREFKSVLTALYDAPEIDADRGVVTWTVPSFPLEGELKAPEGTTHYQFLLATTLLGDHAYDPDLREYFPVEPEFAEKRAVAMGALLPYTGGTTAPETLTTDLGLGGPLPETVISISVVGVLFFQESPDGELYPLKGKQSLRIAKVA
ncbi:MAG: hypothetical protein R2793_07090 [Flavobacteriaceae bacterium]